MPADRRNSAAPSALDRWIDAVNRRDAQAASELYAERDLAFWGTYGGYCRTRRPEAREYFDRFLDVDSMNCEIREIHWRELGAGAAVATGSYAFAILRHGDADTREATARFSIVFCQQPDGGWQIVDHHSSLFPDGAF